MRYSFYYAFLGGLSGALYFLVIIIQAGSLGEKGMTHLMLSFVLGIVGGLIPGLIRETSRRRIPVLQSWIMLLLLIYGMPYLSHHQGVNFYWLAVIYGYMGHLLWDAYRGKLPKV